MQTMQLRKPDNDAGRLGTCALGLVGKPKPQTLLAQCSEGARSDLLVRGTQSLRPTRPQF